jgi:ATP-dependent DNA ligase
MTHETAPSAGTDSGARRVLDTLRPQVYGSGAPHRILDPLVEPLWIGIRALAAVDGAGATLVDAEGGPIEGMEDVVEGLAAAVPAGSAVLDGFLTKQTAHAADLAEWPDEMPSVGQLLGIRRKRRPDVFALKEEALQARTFAPEDEISFVAIDLPWLDDTSLLDVPLLERRRLLDSVLSVSESVRLGPFVRPPVETWAGSWRSQGFTGLTYKGANSRYLPGQPNPDWVATGLRRR